MDTTMSAATALLAGGAAGFCVDISLFPLDTIKTRLQSKHGFWRSGGVHGIYRGIGSVAVGSVPGAAVFFCTYEFVKKNALWNHSERTSVIKHVTAASCGELMACLIRVPVEVVKQRSQVSISGTTSFAVFSATIKQEGFKGLYRGYISTIARELPFSFIQFPLWEYFKIRWRKKQGSAVHAWQSSICGAISGAIAAATTTPLDVAKTRIMLAQSGTKLAKGNILHALQDVWRESGMRGCFAGIVPRVTWIAVGGAIFLGVYDKTKYVLQSLNDVS